MAQNITDRRDFLKSALIAAAAFPVLAGCKVETLAQKADTKLALIKKNAQGVGVEGMGAIDAPANVTWQTAFKIVPDDGEPMIISGTVYKPDGKTVAPDTLIYFYHTDKYGIYGRSGQHKHGRFRGWMLTDARGRYEFASIRPASYPNSTQSQHVHMTVTAEDRKEDWIDSILFEGDKFLTVRERDMAGRKGGFNNIVKLVRAEDGIMRGVRDIQLWQV